MGLRVANALGLMDPKDIAAAKDYAGAAAIDILSQRKGRFGELKTTKVFTGVDDQFSYDLPSNYNSPLFASLVNDDGLPWKRYALPNVFEVQQRLEEGLDKARIAYIDNYFTDMAVGESYRLVLLQAVAAGVSIRLDYFRFPLVGDVVKIVNESMIEHYIAAHFPAQNARAAADWRAYESAKATFGSRAVAQVRDFFAKPPRKTQRQNTLMAKIGRGQ